MTDPPLDPQRTYEALAEALCLFYAHPPTTQALTAVQEAVTQATAVWQRCERQRASSTKEFRAHVVRLKLLLAGVSRTLDLRPGVPCQATSPSSPAVSPSLGQEKH
jgi:hypothetical protein